MEIKLPNSKLIKVAVRREVPRKRVWGARGGLAGSFLGGLAGGHIAKYKGRNIVEGTIYGGLAGLAVGALAGRAAAKEKNKKLRERYASLIRTKIR